MHDLSNLQVRKPISLVGMMGVGKSTVGSRLAKCMGRPFFDSDQEVEKAAGGYTVSDIYELWGETRFKEAEYDIIERLLRTEPVHVLSTGEGAFMEERTRALLRENTITIWLKSDIDVLFARVQRKTRPQLMGAGVDTELLLKRLVQERYPIYQMADICVESNNEFYQDAVERILMALKEFLVLSFT